MENNVTLCAHGMTYHGPAVLPGAKWVPFLWLSFDSRAKTLSVEGFAPPPRWEEGQFALQRWSEENTDMSSIWEEAAAILAALPPEFDDFYARDVDEHPQTSAIGEAWVRLLGLLGVRWVSTE